MRKALIKAVSGARSPEHVVDAIEAGIHAAYINDPRHGHAAALEVLNREQAEPEIVPEEAEKVAEPSETSE